MLKHLTVIIVPEELLSCNRPSPCGSCHISWLPQAKVLSRKTTGFYQRVEQ